MIRLTNYHNEDKATRISPEQIVRVDDYLGGSQIFTTSASDDGVMFVIESPEEVARKVLEYRLAMERYKAAMTQSELTDPKYLSLREEAKLYELSGLSAEKGAEG